MTSDKDPRTRENPRQSVQSAHNLIGVRDDLQDSLKKEPNQHGFSLANNESVGNGRTDGDENFTHFADSNNTEADDDIDECPFTLKPCRVVFENDCIDLDPGNLLTDFADVPVYGTDPLRGAKGEDGLTDSDEVIMMFTNPLNNDGDGDGLAVADGIDECEGAIPMHPCRKDLDTDGDGLNDCIDPDSDNDLLTDFDEVMVYGTDPLNWDTDGDSVDDYTEIVQGTDPGKFDASVSPRVVYVDIAAPGANNGSSWLDAYINLQDALVAAKMGDEIWVAAGIYKPASMDGDRHASFQLPQGVTLLGGFSGTEICSSERRYLSYVTILSGDLNGDDFGSNHNDENSYHVVTGHHIGPETILDGFTIVGGRANGPFENSSGGGIYIKAGSPIIQNCVITENSAVGGSGIFGQNSGGGGGIYIEAGSPTIGNCRITKNSAGGGGGMCIISPSSASVSNCIFDGNRAEGSGGGLAIYDIFDDPFSSLQKSVTNCVFRNNTAQEGGGMSVVEARIAVTGCRFEGNVADLGGGFSAYDLWLLSTPAVIHASRFVRNRARLGGGIINISSDYSDPDIEIYLSNCLLLMNSAERGGAIHNDLSRSRLAIYNCGVIDNFAESETGGISSGWVSIFNSILWGNFEGRPAPRLSQLTIYEDAISPMFHNIIQGGIIVHRESQIPCVISVVENNFDIDPLMTVDRHLTHLSPAIDMGVSDHAPLTDIDGENLVGFTRFDIGPDEFVDLDIDGLPDWMEFQATGDWVTLVPSADRDHDGLDNLTEYTFSTNPALPDSDLDGLLDGEELGWDIEAGQFVAFSDPVQSDTLLAPYNPSSDFTPELSEPVYVGRHSFLRDLDGDGDLDLVYSLIDGSVSYVENVGTIVSPTWSRHHVIGTSSGSKPGVGDVDADGDMDLILVKREGLFFQRNNVNEVTAENQWDNPQRTALDLNQFDDGDLHVLDIVGPTRATGRDGFADLIVVHADGQLTLIANDGDDDPLTWMPPDKSWAGTTVFTNVSKTMGDIDMDGDLDWFAGTTEDGEPRFRMNLDEHLLLFPRYFTVTHGVEQIIEVDLDEYDRETISSLNLEIARNTSNANIDPIVDPRIGQFPNRWRYVAGTDNVGVDIIKGRITLSNGTQLTGLVVVNVISRVDADLVGKALIVAGTRSGNDPLYPISERLAKYAYVVCRQQGYAADNIRLLTPDGKLFSRDGREIDTTHLGWNIRAYGGNTLLESIIKGPWAGSADDLLVYIVDHGIVIDGVAQLLLNPELRVSSSELDQWLNVWQTADKKATVIIDTCYSGRFISELQGSPSSPRESRIVIGSTQPGQLAHFQAAGIISFSQLFWDELSAGATLGAAYRQARAGLADLRQLPTLDFTGDGLADDDRIDESEVVGEFGNPALLSGVQRPVVRSVMPDTTVSDGIATLWVNAGDIVSNHGVGKVFAYIAPPTLRTDVDNGSAIIDMDNVELIDFIARRRIAAADFDGWQKLRDTPDPSDPSQPYLADRDKELLTSNYENVGHGFYILKLDVPSSNKQALRRIEERLGYPPRYEADWTDFSTSGEYRIVFFAQDRWGMLSPAKVAKVTVAGPVAKAIVVECAGTAGVMNLWEPGRINGHGTLVERNLRLRSFTDDSINRFGDAQLTPEKAAIESAITTWAQDAVHLIVYLVGNATSQGLVLANDETITPGDLNGWLNLLPANSARQETIIIDADFGGSFAAGLAGTANRQVLASSGHGGNNVRHGATAFSRWFWNGIGRDRSIQRSFADTLVYARAARIDPSFILDDTSDAGHNDGVYTPKQDGIVTRNLFIGRPLPTGEGELEIGQVGEALAVGEGGVVRLWAADIVVPDGSTPTVWAEVIPPAYTIGDPLDRVDLLFNDVSGRYELPYQFSLADVAGKYIALIHAASAINPEETALPVPVEIYYKITIPPGNRTTDIGIPQIAPDADVVNEVLSANSEDNLFRFWAANGERFTIDVEPAADAAADLVLRVLSQPVVSDAPIIAADDWGTGFEERIWNWQAAATGWYYVHIDTFSASRSEVHYTLRLKKEQGARADGYEIDDAPELARFISLLEGEFQSHNFDRQQDNDWIQFRLLKDYSYTIMIDGIGVNCEPILEWYDNGDLASPIRCLSTLPRNSNAPPSCEQAQVDVRALTVDTGVISDTGSYYLRMRNAVPAFGLGTEYSIRIFDTVGPGLDAEVSGLLRIKDDPNHRLLPASATIEIFDGTDVDDLNVCCGDYITLLAAQATDYTLTATAAGYQPDVATVTATSGAQIRLDFELTPITPDTDYTISIHADNGRVVNLNNPYSPGSEALLIPRPDLHYSFSHWSGPAVVINATNESANPLRFTVTDDIPLMAHFVARQYELEIRNSESCADCGLPLLSGTYDPGHTATWAVTSPWPSESGSNDVRYVAEVSSGSVRMDRDRTIELDWIKQYFVDITWEGLGSLTKGSGWRNDDEVLRIVANGSQDSRFANWIINGRALIDNPLQVPIDGPMAIIAEFVPITSLDINGDGNTDVETDGMLILRFLFGFTGPALTEGIVGPAGAPRSAQQIVEYLDMIRAAGVLDIDGNNQEDALTDGIMILRYIADYRGNSLSKNAVDGSDCRRCEDDVVEHFLDAFTP